MVSRRICRRQRDRAWIGVALNRAIFANEWSMSRGPITALHTAGLEGRSLRAGRLQVGRMNKAADKRLNSEAGRMLSCHPEQAR